MGTWIALVVVLSCAAALIAALTPRVDGRRRWTWAVAPPLGAMAVKLALVAVRAWF